MPFVAFVVFPMDPGNVLRHCHNNGWLSLPHNKPICHFWQHPGVKKGAGNPRGMAMVYCDWRLWMPFVAFVVFPMDPGNVLRHCHNNGWLSLPHNKPICHFWQHPGVKKGAGNPRGMAMVYCDWRLWMPFVAFVVFPMDPGNVLRHCHNNGWLSLPHNKPICHFWQHPGVKKGAGNPRGMAMVYCDWRLWMPFVAFVVFPMDPGNVLRHWHTNGLLSFPHNKPICHFWQLPGVKKGAGNPRGMAMVYCDWRLWMPFVAFVVFPMDPGNVLRHCHNNAWLSLPHNKPICHFWQHPGVKKGAGNPRGMAMVYCDWWLWMPFVAFVVFPMDPG